MHSTIVTSIAGQTRPGTMRGATMSMTIAAPILTNPHHNMLTALTIGEIELIRLVAPRAIKAPGSATTAAP